MSAEEACIARRMFLERDMELSCARVSWGRQGGRANGGSADLEVGFEEEVGDVVGCPFAGFFHGAPEGKCVSVYGENLRASWEHSDVPVTDTQLEKLIEHSPSILKIIILAAGLRSNIVLKSI